MARVYYVDLATERVWANLSDLIAAVPAGGEIVYYAIRASGSETVLDCARQHAACGRKPSGVIYG